MSDDRPAIKAATAVAETLPERFRRVSERNEHELLPAGECVVCRGQLLPDMELSRLGVRGRWYCERCGICTHHLPSRPPGISDDTLQH